MLQTFKFLAFKLSFRLRENLKDINYLWIDEEEKVGHAEEREKDQGGSDCPPHLYLQNVKILILKFLVSF